MEHRNKVFRDQEVRLDGNAFIECRFEGCNLVYGGDGAVGLQGCTFDKVEWEFVGEAANTLAFLSSLYHHFGKGGQDLVENIFEQIRSPPTN